MAAIGRSGHRPASVWCVVWGCTVEGGRGPAPLTRVVASVLSAALILLALNGCARSAESYLDRGNAHLAKGNVDAAVLEFRNAVRRAPTLAAARLKLAEAYLQQGNAAGAAAESVRAADLLPQDVKAQLKAGSLLLAVGNSQEALARADKALALAPGSADAFALRAEALAMRNDLDGAIAQMDKAIELSPTGQRLASLGTLLDAKGRRQEAEAAFRRAVSTDPSSVVAHLALGKFLSATRRGEEAERAVKAALALDPANVMANQAMAALYLSSNRAGEAERYLKKVAEMSREGGPVLGLAEYYLAAGRSADALTVLEKLSARPRDWAVARTRTAAVLYSVGKKAEALRAIDEVVEKRPAYVEALVTRGRMRLAEGKIEEALLDANRAVKVAPQAADARFLVGSIRVAKRDLDGAASAFQEVLRLDPRATAAQVELAKVELLRGQATMATQLAEQAVVSMPGSLEAQLVLARGLLAGGNIDRAGTVTLELLRAYPRVAAVHSQAGVLAMRRGDRAGAQAAFEKALALDPLLLEPLAGLVDLDHSQNRGDRAQARIKERLTRTPRDTGLLVLAAKTWGASGDLVKAEEYLRRAIDADAMNFEAYGLLGGLYVSQKRLDEALREFDRLAARRPDSIGPRTMAALILAAQGKREEARQRYERLVEAEPRAAVASNNLAWMYASRGEQLDRALQLAQAATGVRPDDPEVNDTLGFVYLRKRLPSLAVPPLALAVARAPDNPVYHYHLGLAYAGAGDSPAARQALERALRLKPDFEGADDARAMLRTLR